MSKINGKKPSVTVSQNFLTSGILIRRLLSLTDIGSGDLVLDIGAGKGHLTDALLRQAGAVHAIELDRRLFERLRERYSGCEALRLTHGDFLRMRLPPQGCYKVFSNIPFSVTTAIVQKLTRTPNPPTDAWLVMERGAAMRFCGLPRENLQSLLIKPYFKCNILYRFHRQDFHPMPSVDTVLVHFKRKTVPDLSGADRQQYADFVTRTLRKGLFNTLSKSQTAGALRRAGLPPVSPSGDILYVQWLCLFRCSRELHKG